MKSYLLIIASVMIGMGLGFITIPTKPNKIIPHKAIPVKSERAAAPVPDVVPSHIKSIKPPAGFEITDIPKNHFGQWIQQLPLRKNNTVYLYDGSVKKNQSSHFAVLDVSYNRHPLQQCADAIMRLRAEYIFETKSQENICFYHQHNTYFTCPSTCTRPQLESFLNNVFSWCGSYNLQAQLKPVTHIQDIQTGDVFVRGGSPGHAMLVAGVAKNSRGQKVFLLLQSFMPAQDIHIVINPHNAKLSPWYSVDDYYVVTPGWNFTAADLRRW
jgi:hypothetical protein